VVVIAVVGALRQRTNRHEEKVVFGQVRTAWKITLYPVDVCRLLSSVVDVEIDVGHLGPKLEDDSLAKEPAIER
jgi:hypothetical protein